MNREDTDRDGKALLDAAAKLPQDIALKRDLWPEIAAQLESHPVKANSSQGVWRIRFLGWAASFAGVIIAVLIVFTSTLMSSGGKSSKAVTTVLDSVPIAPEFLPITQDPSYRAARAELLTSFEKQLATLPPEDRAKVEQGLKDIQNGLQALNQALQRNPDNAALRRLVLGAYQRELEYMQTIDTLTESMPRDLSI